MLEMIPNPGITFAREVQDELADILDNARIFVDAYYNHREQGLIFRCENIDKIGIPYAHQPIAWVYCNRHTDLSECVLSNSAHIWENLPDDFAWEHHRITDCDENPAAVADLIVKHFRKVADEFGYTD